MKSILLSGSALAIALATFVYASLSVDDTKPVILRKQFEGLQFEFFNNSPTMSQALGINSSGAIVGFKESADNLRQVYFFCTDDKYQEMPMPKGYTNVEAVGISDNNLIIGHTTKAIGTEGSLRAVVWSPEKAEIQLLPTPESDGLSDASDISNDGKRITGYATGKERLRPVIWQWNEKESKWSVEVLPTEHEYNPYLMSSQLVISPDGSIVVGCCTEQFGADGTLDSALYEWRQVEGKWTRRLVTKEQMYVKAINNKGQIAGSVVGQQGRLPCLVTSDGKIKLLDLLEGDVGGEARDINDQSIIVGWSDDPPGHDGGPMSCTWNLEGKVTPVKANELGFGMLYGINNAGQIAGTAEVITKAASSPTAGDEEAAMLAVRISKSN